VFIKLLSAEARRRFRKKKTLQKLYQTLNEWEIHPYRSALKLSLLADLQHKVCELVPYITSCPIIIILKYFKFLCRKNVVNSNTGHRHHVFPSHFHVLLGVGNFTKVVRVSADCLWTGPRLHKICSSKHRRNPALWKQSEKRLFTFKLIPNH
jgi:hypothetical protein